MEDNIQPSILFRQPPSPRRHHRSLIAANKDEEGNTEMVGGNRTRTYYFRRCKRKRLMNMDESLPDELLFEILLRLPAQDIFDPARFVCRKWYRMICNHNFIYAHLQHATYGLLFHSASKDSIFATVRQGRIEISKLSRFRLPPVPASCNGLVLDFQLSEPYILNIVNPVTKQFFVLPPCFRAIPGGHSCGIAYAAASMEYKVVASYGPCRDPKIQPSAILTVGVDKSWRILCTQHLPFIAKQALPMRPLTTEGFMHWPTWCGSYLLTLDVETEVIRETPPPVPRVYGHGRVYLSTGRYLSLLITCRELLWEVWEMIPISGEWRKLPDITLEAQKCTIERFGLKSDEFLVPIGWLKYPEVLAFGFSRQNRAFVILYNLVKEEIDSIELPTLENFCTPVVHKNSLVWLAGC